MDIDEIKSYMSDLRKQQEEVHAADTPENEARLIGLMKSKGVIVARGRRKGPQRYTVTISNGSIGPATLYDIENLWKKMSGGKA